MNEEEYAKLRKELIESAKALGVGKERNRILRGLNEANLPPSIWPLIADIIYPPEEQTNEKKN